MISAEPPTSKVNLAPPAVRATWAQLKQHAVTTLGTAALLCLPLAFVGVIVAARPGLAASVLQMVVGGLIGIWVGYAATIAVGMYVRGEDPGVGGLLRRSVSVGLVRFGFASLALTVVMAIAAFLAIIPLLMTLATVGLENLLAGRISDGAGLRLLLAVLFTFPVLAAALLFVYLRFGLTQTAAGLDGTGPVSSLGRSWQVTKGRVWDFFLLGLISVAISIAVGIVVTGPATIVSLPSQLQPSAELTVDSLDDLFPAPLGPAQSVISGISTYLATVLLGPVTAALLANFFLLAKNPPTAATPRTLVLPPPDHPSSGGRPADGDAQGSPNP